jgi:signal transduction histidine kinase
MAAEPRPISASRGRIYAALGLLALVCNLGFLLLQTIVGTTEREVRGVFPATIHAAGGDVERALTFPGVLDLAPHPGDTPVTVRIPVDVDAHAGDWAVLLRHPVNHAELRWDGAVLAGTTSGNVGAGTTVIAAVPAALATPGTHRLEVRVDGVHGMGGALGELFVGPFEAVRRQADSLDFQVVALSSALHAAAMVWVALAMFRPRRTEYLWGGLLWAALGVHYFCWSEAWPLAVQGLDTRIVVRESAGLAACVLAVGFAGHFGAGARWLRAPAIAFGAAMYAYSLLLPWHRDYGMLRVVATVTGAVMLLVCTVFFVSGARAGDRLARSMLLANAVPASVFGLVLLTQPLLTDQLVLPALVTFVLWVTILLFAHDAEHSERYAHLFARARDAVLVVDRDGTVLDANAEAARVLSARPGEMLAGGGTPEALRAVREHLQGAGDGRRAEIELPAPDGTRIVESAAVDMDDSVLLVARDVTGRALAERSLKRLSRMESVGMMASSLVHDLNNALTGLLAQVDILRAAASPGQAARLDTISDSIVRVGRTSRQVVALVREGPPVARPVDLGEVAREFTAWVQAHAVRRARVELHVADGLPAIEAVRLDLEQVVVNLVGNALRVTPDAGTVRVRVERVADELVLSVEDEGPGVPPELRDRVWEPFFTTREAGNGIGLAVVARVTRDLGGRVAIEDARVGARFVVRLPVGGVARGVGSAVGVVAEDAGRLGELLAMLRERGFSAHEAMEGGPVCDVLVIDARGASPPRACTHPRQVWVLDATTPSVLSGVQVVRAPVRAEALGAAVRVALFGA